MKARGKKYLLTTGTLEIIIGLLSILGIVSLLMVKENIPGMTQSAATQALGSLLILYTLYGIRILGGLLGVIFSDRPKHSGMLVLFGFILIMLEIWTWQYATQSIGSIIINILFMLVPCYYFYGAVLNYKDMTTPEPVKRTSKKTATTKSAPTLTEKKSTAKKKATKNSTTAKKPAAKKTAAKKTTTKKTTKAEVKKPAAKKTVTKKTTPKKTTTKNSTKTKKPAAKKTAAKKTTTKKTTKK